MFATQIVKENNRPKFVIMDYEIYEKFYDLIEELEDKYDARLNVKELGPRIPFEVAEKILDGSSPIAAWREYKGLTQAELAKKMKLSQAAVSSMESVQNNPRLATLKKVAKVLDCPVQSLIVD